VALERPRFRARLFPLPLCTKYKIRGSPKLANHVGVRLGILTLVDDDQTKVAVILGEHRGDELAQIGRAIPSRDHNVDGGLDVFVVA